MVKVKLTALQVIINLELHEVTRPTRGNKIINKSSVTDPKCPQHPSKMGRPRFNAQRLIKDNTEGEDVIQEEHPEEHEDVQDANSWGGL